MAWKTRGVTQWDVRTERQFHPYYALGRGYVCDGARPAVVVNVSAEFDDDAQASEFERRVRGLLAEYNG